MHVTWPLTKDHVTRAKEKQQHAICCKDYQNLNSVLIKYTKMITVSKNKKKWNPPAIPSFFPWQTGTWPVAWGVLYSSRFLWFTYIHQFSLSAHKLRNTLVFSSSRMSTMMMFVVKQHYIYLSSVAGKSVVDRNIHSLDVIVVKNNTLFNLNIWSLDTYPKGV